MAIGAQTQVDIAHAFLVDLWGDDPLPGHLIIICAPPWAGKAFTTLADAAEAAIAGDANRRDAYHMLGLQSEVPAAGKRGTPKTTCAIPGVWLDVDVDSFAHAKKGLPPTCEAALAALAALGEPTIEVHSGHGMHLYWAFREPWVFEPGSDEATDAAQLVEDWQRAASQVLRRHGWACDLTHDLARVLRVPGTTNRKNGQAVPVEYTGGGPRYVGSDLREAIGYVGYRRPVRSAAGVVGEGVVGPVGAPDPDVPRRIMLICQVDDEFKRVWERRANGKLPSASEYDLSIASRLAAVEWVDADIVGACQLWRSLHGEDATKINRADYVSRLLTRARSSSTIQSESRPVLAVVSSPGDSSSDDRAARIAEIAAATYAPLKDIAIIPGTRPSYRFTVPDKFGADQHVFVTGANLWESARAFRSAVSSVAGTACRRFKSEAWDKVVERIHAVATPLDAGDERWDERRVRAMVDAYTSANESRALRPGSEEDIPPSGPFWWRTSFYTGLSSLVTEAKLTGQPIKRPELAGLMRSAGYTSTVIHRKPSETRRTTRQVWRLADSGG